MVACFATESPHAIEVIEQAFQGHRRSEIVNTDQGSQLNAAEFNDVMFKQAEPFLFDLGSLFETRMHRQLPSPSRPERRDEIGPNSGPNSGNTGAGNLRLSSEKGHSGDCRVAESLGSSPISHPKPV